MLVYRLENNQGEGPFQSPPLDTERFAHEMVWPFEEWDERMGIISLLFNSWGPTRHHPHHLDDIPNSALLLGDNNNWRVGTESKNALLHWFPLPAMQYLESDMHQCVVVYDVPDENVRKGKFQLMFHDGERVARYYPTEDWVNEQERMDSASTVRVPASPSIHG